MMDDDDDAAIKQGTLYNGCQVCLWYFFGVCTTFLHLANNQVKFSDSTL
jgi:hypothetical protein